MPEHADQLQIDQDLAFQRHEWKAQRVGWWALTAFVLAATLGVFGKGPLSHARAGTPGAPLWVDYDRFVRVGSGTRIVVNGQAAAHGGADSVFVVRMNRQYFDGIRIEQLSPQPISMTVGADVVDLHFAGAAAGTRVTVVLDVEPLRAGRSHARFTTARGEHVSFTQFAYF